MREIYLYLFLNFFSYNVFLLFSSLLLNLSNKKTAVFILLFFVFNLSFYWDLLLLSLYFYIFYVNSRYPVWLSWHPGFFEGVHQGSSLAFLLHFG